MIHCHVLVDFLSLLIEVIEYLGFQILLLSDAGVLQWRYTILVLDESNAMGTLAWFVFQGQRLLVSKCWMTMRTYVFIDCPDGGNS